MAHIIIGDTNWDLEALGVRMTGDLHSLLSYPPSKQPYTNDWAERDGLDVDLTDMRLDSRQVTIDFAYSNESTHGHFIHLLRQGDPCYLIPDELNAPLVFPLYFVGDGQYDTDGIVSSQVKFRDDSAFSMLPSALVPQGQTGGMTILADEEYDIGEFGAMVLHGVREAVTATGDVKGLQIESARGVDGASVYGVKSVASRELTLEFSMSAGDTFTLISNYVAFLKMLIQDDERIIIHEGLAVSCYYVKSQVIHLYSGFKQIHFSVTFRTI